MTRTSTGGLPGRQAQAARNDEVILAAARAVFMADPEAPISAVAKRAGVGISALYRRYASKEELLRKLCGDGLNRYIEEVEAALADQREPWEAFAAFMHRLVDANTNSLAQRLAGTFTPSEELYRNASRAGELTTRLFDRTASAGVLRPDVEEGDLAMILEGVTSVKLGDDQRTNQLRHRYLTLFLDALHRDGTPLPGPPPTPAELNERWNA
jgi:AcrR family transcriptional regulator